MNLHHRYHYHLTITSSIITISPPPQLKNVLHVNYFMGKYFSSQTLKNTLHVKYFMGKFIPQNKWTFKLFSFQLNILIKS
jgi:hypothetical protein